MTGPRSSAGRGRPRPPRSAVLALALLLAGGAGAVRAQQPSHVVTGHVTDASGKPLPGAEVFVPSAGGRATFGTVTNEAGAFTLRLPPGPVRLSARLLGYKPATETLAGDRATVDFALTTDVLNLDQIVVTGQATGVSRRNLANAVSTVNASELAVVPAASVEGELAGKVAGANIQGNSGAPGGGLQVQLRGVSTIIGNAAPLVVVDGVIVSDQTIESGTNAVTQAGSGIATDQDNSPDRLADLNPADIEKLEILKGASAAAIYGSKANNGVLIITTRRGAPGAIRYQFSQRLGFSELTKELGTRVFRDSATAVGAFGAAAAPYFAGGKTPTLFDHEKQLAGGHPLSNETQLSVSGGSDRTTYYVSGLMKKDGGIVNGTFYDKQSITVSVDQVASERLRFGVHANALHTLSDRGFTNNDNTSTSYFLTLTGTPSFVDLRQRADGTWPVNPFQASNPLQTAALAQNREDVSRFIGSVRGDLNLLDRPGQSLRLSALGGGDFFTQQNRVYSPEDLQYEPLDGYPGTSVLSNSLSRNLNTNVSLVHSYTPTGGFLQATTSAGMQYEYHDLDVARVLTQDLFPGQQDVGAGVFNFPEELRSRTKDLSYFGQEELLLFEQRWLLTGSVRADRSSADAFDTKWYYYPKFNSSYRFTLNRGPLDELKLRIAYGQAGNEPQYGQKFNSLSPGSLVGLQTLALGTTTVAHDLHPERQVETEGGVDMTLFGGRASVELTGYERKIHDLLLNRSLAPSTGFGTALYNSHGSLRTKGVEAALTAEPLKHGSFDWTSHITFSKYRSVIDSLDVPPFNYAGGGFGTSLGAVRIQQGKSATQIVGRDTVAVLDDPRCLEALSTKAGSGVCKPGTRFVTQLGDATPDFRMGFVDDFRFARFRLSTTLDWQKGGNVVNLTGFLLDANQNTADFDTPCTVTPACKGKTMGEYRLSIYPGRTSKVWIESATFLKLREVQLTYDVPQRFLASSRIGAGVKSMQLSVSGRDLLTVSGYSGYDPEVNNFGNQAIRGNIDVTPYPPSRQFWFAVNLGF